MDVGMHAGTDAGAQMWDTDVEESNPGRNITEFIHTVLALQILIKMHILFRIQAMLD